MRGCAFRWLGIAIGSLLLSIPLAAQTSTEAETAGAAEHLGYPQDWSSRQLIMSGARVDDVLAAGQHDPRQVYNYVMRQMAIENSRKAKTDLPISLPTGAAKKKPIKIDWAVSLENGYVPQNQFPAKFGFSLNSENCTSDYVLFGLTVSTGTQANLVGINNLYTSASPACNGGAPTVAFAYNTVTQTGGQIKTSPVLSEDGTKVAFIESTSAGSYFHVLVLPSLSSQTGTVLSPQTPMTCTFAVNVGCMTTLTIETTATNSNSSPWVDYDSDAAYVGADNGILYKISPVFGGGTPVLVSNTNWPVTLAATGQSNKILTAPVIDVSAGKIFVGDGYGYLYALSLANPGKTYASRVAIGWVGNGPGTGVIDPPLVVNDSANSTTDQIFAFTGCSSVVGIGGAVTQIAANFTSSTTITTSNSVDLGSATGAGDCTTLNVHQGAFDNAFWLHGTTSGHMIACGFVQSGGIPSNPKMFFFPFASHIITSTGASNFVINATAKGDECSPLTEFYDGTTDRLFFGAGDSSDAHLESSIITTSLVTPTCSTGATSTCTTAPSALGGTSAIVVDNQLSNGGTNIYFSTLANGSVNGQKCNVSGGAANPKCAVKLTQSALN